MNKISYFVIILGVFVLTFSVLNAQDTCPWDQHLYENECKQMPDLSDFLAGKRYVLPASPNYKGFINKKYPVSLILKLLQSEEVEIAADLKDLKTDEQTFFMWIVDYVKNRKADKANQLVPTDINYDLGNDWRMRGASSQRPNDKVQVEFKERKTDVFRQVMGKTLGIKSDAVLLTPGNFTLEFFEVLQAIESANFSKFNEFRAELFFAFGEVLTITGLKHNAFRAYLQSAELTKNDRQHEISTIAAREIKQSMRADFDKFEDTFLQTQKEEAQKFNVAFTLFAQKHAESGEFKDFAKMKALFQADYSNGSKSSVLLLVGAGIFVLLMLIILSRKCGG
ncbi:MAG: hypothetical protein K8S87_02845 [Planctomycetes bacterium]|nr:hypothetical protein [Planctomycetota bacterium]